MNEREKQESRVEARIKVNIVQDFNWISTSSLFLTLFSILFVLRNENSDLNHET